MSLSDEQKSIRYRNLLLVIATQVGQSKARAAKLKAAAASETHPGKKAGLRTLLHCTNRNTQILERMLGGNRAALREFFGTCVVEKIEKYKIILHKL